MVGAKRIVRMWLLQSEKNQVSNGWSKTDSKYGFAPTREKSGQ